MKKLLSFVIVAMMIVSLVVPAFAVIGEAPEPSGETNTFDVYLSTSAGDETLVSEDELTDDVIDADTTTQFVVYANLANNFDGFEYCRFYVIYPECLSLVEHDIVFDPDEEPLFLDDGDLTYSSEHTDSDDVNFQRTFGTLLGLDPDEVLAGGKKWTSPLIDAERSARITNPNTGSRVKTAVDFSGEAGPMVYFIFSYDASKNPSNADVEIECWSDPEGGLHAELEDWNDPNGWCSDWAYYRAYGITIPVSGGEPACQHENTTEVITKAATCTETGLKNIVCADCGAVLEENVVIPAAGHDYVAGEPVAPTCTEGGYTTYTCSKCGDSYTADATEPAGHDYSGEWVRTTEPQVGVPGEDTLYCKVCGAAIDTRAVDPLPEPPACEHAA